MAVDLRPGVQEPGVRGQGSAASVCCRVENSPRPSLYAGPASHGTRDLSLAGLQLTAWEQHSTDTVDGHSMEDVSTVWNLIQSM